jgi:hypothetical protein
LPAASFPILRRHVYGRKLGPIADAASMLCRDEDEVRQKAKELGLVERPKIW